MKSKLSFKDLELGIEVDNVRMLKWTEQGQNFIRYRQRRPSDRIFFSWDGISHQTGTPLYRSYHSLSRKMALQDCLSVNATLPSAISPGIC